VEHDFDIKNGELVDAHAKLLEDFELLKNDPRVIESGLIKTAEPIPSLVKGCMCIS
jgi:hypothetical protein